MVHLDMSDVRLTALKVIYDLLMWHGLPAFIDNSAPKSVSEGSDDGRRAADEVSTVDSALDSDVTSVYRQVSRSLTRANENKHRLLF